MNPMIKAIACAAALSLALPGGARSLTTENVDIRVAGNFLNISADIVLDSLRLGSNRQLFITPVVKGDTAAEKVLPSVLVNGRNMHYSYERGLLKGFPEMRGRVLEREVRRDNGHGQKIEYSVRVPLEGWMSRPGTSLSFVVDSCGCGVRYGERISEEYPVIPPFENPVKEMRTIMIRPPYTEPPIIKHEGKARVQFEVDQTVLHVNPYTCKNGQRIDNRDEIKMIDDSVKYALTDPNVELTSIEICGYASPESPYRHNDELATGRSKALAEFLAEHYHLPQDRVTYSAVPENWGEFREMVVKSDELTEQQRADLLKLIDEPAFTPAEYDRKERILTTDPKFRDLYRTKIRPEWFPKLRATTFSLHTQLKPMTDEELMRIIETTPEKMSLNQMFRVARMYPEGSADFNRVIEIALKHYPDDPVAILNAAAAAAGRGEYAKAKELLVKAPETPETNNLLGIIATSEEKYDLARTYFEKAGDFAPAKRNLNMLPKD